MAEKAVNQLDLCIICHAGNWPAMLGWQGLKHKKNQIFEW